MQQIFVFAEVEKLSRIGNIISKMRKNCVENLNVHLYIISLQTPLLLSGSGLKRTASIIHLTASVMPPLLCFTHPLLSPLRLQVKQPLSWSNSPPVCTAVDPFNSHAKSSRVNSAPPCNVVETPRHYTVPFVGYLLERMVFNVLPETLLKKYGMFYRANYLGYDSLVIGEMETIRTVVKDPSTFMNEGSMPDPVTRVITREMLVNIDDRKHALARRRIVPLFCNAALNRLVSKFLPTARRMWNDVFLASQNTASVNLEPYVKPHLIRGGISLTTDASNATDIVIDEIYRLSNIIMRSILFPTFTPPSWDGIKARNELGQLLGTIIREHARSEKTTLQELANSDGDKHTDLTDLSPFMRSKVISGEISLFSVLCAMWGIGTEDSEVIDDQKIDSLSSQLVELWFASSVTSVSPVLNSVLELGKDTALVEKLREEQLEAIKRGGGADQDEHLVACVLNAKSELPMLASFVEEILRFYPPSSFLFRIAKKDTVVKGHKVREGDFITLDVFGAQRFESNYKNAAEFQPERFLPRNDGLEPEAILTFGAPGSPHLCVAHMYARHAIMSAVSLLLREYDFELDPTVLHDELKLIPMPGLRNGVKLSTMRRRNC